MPPIRTFEFFQGFDCAGCQGRPAKIAGPSVSIATNPTVEGFPPKIIAFQLIALSARNRAIIGIARPPKRHRNNVVDLVVIGLRCATIRT